MYRMYLYKASLFAFGAALIVLGIVIVSQREVLITPLAYFAGAVLMIHGGLNIAEFIAHGGRLGQKRKSAKIFTAVWNVATAVLLMALPELSFSLAAYILAAYLLFNAASKIADFIVAKINHQQGRFAALAAFVFYMIFVGLLAGTGLRNDTFLVIAGVYCILFGAETLSDLLTLMVPQRIKNDLKRHIRISPPVFVSTFIPLGTLRYINEYISVNDKLPELTAGSSETDTDPPDIEVMVHVSNNGSGKIGHLDLFFDGEIISYGNHDHSSHRLFGVFGDGVMFTAEKETYLDFSVNHDRQIVFSYGIRLTQEQLEAVRAEVQSIKALAVPWRPPYQVACEEKGEENVKLSDYHDYCSELWNGTRASFFKFSEGKFRTYSILSTNCVLLTDEILGKAGTDIVCITGVASPGIYYDYLERLYLTQKTMVISKTIYDRKTMRKLKKGKEEKNERSVS
ncbi:MAG: DUF308 domain-containing protein [Ruminiclostridium sp.]|nr:DUF308 domain-containing protein [Ruminiclostridium sp.]